ncbi:MAG: AAA family ATPase [Rubrivivax sp.]|nr:AAA family ATPase [Rubrivivax sp.]
MARNPAARAPALHLSLAHAPRLQAPGVAGVPLSLLDGALLAWLALEGPTPRGRVAALLWPHSEPEAARNSLRQRLFKLRQHSAAPLLGSGAALALAEGVTHDLLDADGVLGDEPLAIGPEFDAWLAQQRLRRSDRLQQQLRELCEGAEAAADWPDALAHAHELLALAPTSEDAHCRLMRLHYLAGDRSAALLAFDACERLLKDEVGARPSPATLALLATIEQVPPPLALVPAGRRVPASVLRPPRLVGRAAPWQAIEDAWAAGQLVLLSGEGGMGKSRLAGDFASAHGVAVAAGARPGDERSPYAAFSRLLRALPGGVWAALAAPLRQELARLLPELGDAPPPLQGDTQRARFFNAVAALFGPGSAAAEGVCFDDLHLADEASLELLQYVVDAHPGRWLVGCRLAEAPPAARGLAQAWLSRPEAVHVPLPPLTLAEVAELVDSLGLDGVAGQQVAPALRRRSGGNPLFLLETLKAGWLQDTVEGCGGGGGGGGGLALVHGAAPGVHALIERRISRLSAAAVQVARCAAVAAPDFSIELAAHVLALRTLDLADPCAELEAAQVLVDGAFVHDLVFEAALASVPAAVARQLHAEVAAFLATRRGEAARLAHHWAAAERWREAAPAFAAAAARALEAGRTAAAAALLADAAAAFQRCGGAGERFDALVERARLLANSNPGPLAQAAVAEVQALARDAPQRLAALDVQLTLAMGRSETYLQLDTGRQALAAARAAGRADLELRFALLVADALCDLRRAGEAVALLEPYAAWARAHAEPEMHFDYWSGVGMALDYADRLREALPAWGSARDVAQRAGRSDLVWRALANAASTQAKMGFVGRAAQQVEQACQIARAESGDAAAEPSVRLQQTQVTWAHRLRDLGHYTPALALLESALEAFERVAAGADAAGAEHRLAQLFQQLGQPARAKRLLATERSGLPPGLAMMRLVHRADLAHQLGRDGLPQMREALAVINRPDDVYHRLASLFATRLLPPEEGEAVATSLAAWASARERLGMALAGHVRAAACALALGAPRRARPHVEAALHLVAERQPDSFYLPELWLVAGQVEAALGQAAVAVVHWQSGAAWVQRTATAQVPAAYRESFLRRNAVNAELLQRAAGGGA